MASTVPSDARSATSSPLRGCDLFAGAGGTSTGATQAGVQITLALNHSPRALASHQANHPGTTHRCVDLSQADPGVYHGTDLLLASPECRFFSSAKQPTATTAPGEIRDPEVALKSRATGFDMLRWLDRWRHSVAIVENVPRWRSWQLFPTLLDGLTQLGYDHQIVYRNAAVDGAASWRDRMFLVVWRRELPRPELEVSGPGRCPTHGLVHATQRFTRTFTQRHQQVTAELATGRRRQPLFDFGRYQHDWDLVCSTCDQPVPASTRTAADVLDPGQPAAPVHGRDVPLRPATIARLRRGLARHGRPHPDEPDVRGDGRRDMLVLNYSPHGRVWPATAGPLNTITGVDSHAVLTVDRLDPANDTSPLPAATVDRLLATATYRMLTVDELRAAMGFPAGYQLAGNGREQRIQLGLAVAPPTAEALVSQTMPTLRAGQGAAATVAA